MLEHIETFTNRFKARSTILFVLLVSILSLSACGGSDGDDEFKEAVKVNDLKITSITISSPNTISLPSIIEVDAVEDFIAMAEIDSGATNAIDISDQVRWTSSDPSIISISSLGRATGIADGTVEIRAELADLFGSKELSASSAALTSIVISLEDELVSLTSIGVCTSHQQFTAMGTFADGRVSDVTSNIIWASTAEEVVEIDNKGTVTALIVGGTVISGAHENGVVSNDFPLTVADTLDSITVTPDNVTLNEGGSQQFLAMGSYSGLVDDQDVTTTVTWVSDNTLNLSISNVNNSEGLATAIAVGDADVTASCGDNSDTVSVAIVAPATIVSVKINGDREAETGSVGDSPIELVATIQYSDNSTDLDVTDDNDTTWSVESGTSVTVSDSGVVTIVSAGSTTIKVLYDNDVVSKTANIDIDIN